jgi:hypothetical protein
MSKCDARKRYRHPISQSVVGRYLNLNGSTVSELSPKLLSSLIRKHGDRFMNATTLLGRACAPTERFVTMICHPYHGSSSVDRQRSQVPIRALGDTE